MRHRLRENAVCASAAGAGCAAMAWLGLYGFAWNDYETEARPAVEALVHGHVLGFLRLAPAYGGSLVERAPFALLPGLWGGGALAVYRALALPCLLAAATLSVWLCARMRAEGRSMLARAVAVGVLVANPLTLSALELGHPEELLGACLCVAAVMLASRNRPMWAGVLLGLAIANKEWALLAAGPVLLALAAQPRAGQGRRPTSRRRPVVGCLASASIVTALILGPLALVSAGGFVASTRAATVQGVLFQPWQVWWFLGSHGSLVRGEFGMPLHGFRTGPSWTGTISHPLIIAIGLGLAAALGLQRRRRRRLAVGERSAMLLLALVMLLRCMLDTWNTGYYMLPFAIALLAWEVRGADRPPILVLAGIMLPWFALQELSAHGASPDAQAALFLAWTVPLATWLALRLFAPASATLARSSARTRGIRVPPAATATGAHAVPRRSSSRSSIRASR
ncbi:MAG: glycosyltransferase 87 family protein [Solirubrobacteraceae bacterium]